MDSQIINDNSEGMQHGRGNELISDSKIPQGDASFLRAGSKKVEGGSGGGGGIAFDLLEGAEFDEPHKASRKAIGLITCAQDPQGHTELIIHALKQNGDSVDAHMLKAMRIVTGNTLAESTIEFLMPTNLTGGQATGNRQRLESASGKFVYQLQDDAASGPFGALIVYDTGGNLANEAGWTAVAALRPSKL